MTTIEPLSAESDEAFIAAGGENIKNDREYRLARAWFRVGYDLATERALAKGG